MRAEHRKIEALIAAVEHAIGEPSACPEPSRHELHEVLAQHNAKEEQILYRGADRLMVADARDELVRRIQAYRR